MAEECEAQSIEECGDKYADVDEGDKKQVGFPLDAEKHFRWQKHADEHYAGRYSSSAHPGQISKMVKNYVKACMTVIHKSDIGNKDPHVFIRESALDSGSLLNKKNKLEKELERKNTKIKELERQLEEQKDKTRLEQREGLEKLRYAVKMAVREEPKTVQEIEEELKDIGIAEDDITPPEVERRVDGDFNQKTMKFGELVNQIIQRDPQIVEKDTKEVNEYIEFSKYGIEDPRE